MHNKTSRWAIHAQASKTNYSKTFEISQIYQLENEAKVTKIKMKNLVNNALIMYRGFNLGLSIPL